LAISSWQLAIGKWQLAKTKDKPFTAEDAKVAEEPRSRNQHLNHTFATLSAGSGHRVAQRKINNEWLITNGELLSNHCESAQISGKKRVAIAVFGQLLIAICQLLFSQG
jgi:hypothetical protein